MKPTETVAVGKIDLTSQRDEIASKQAAVETPVTIYVKTQVIKAARVGIPVTVSTRGSTYPGVFAAQKTGITPCCYARGGA